MEHLAEDQQAVVLMESHLQQPMVGRIETEDGENPPNRPPRWGPRAK